MKIEDYDQTGPVKYIVNNPMDMFTKQRIWDAFTENHMKLMEIRELCDRAITHEVVDYDKVLEIIDRGMK